MTMTIGLVTGEYPPMEGGVGAFSSELAKAMASSGHRVHIITDRSARPDSASRRWQDLVEPVDLGYAHLHPRVRRWRWPSLALVADITRRYELDLVNIQYQAAAYDMRSPAANLLPWRLKGMAATVVTFHDLRVPYLFPKAGPVRQAAIHFMARQSRGVITTNRADFEALVGTLEPGRLAQIPIGSNIAPSAADAADVQAIRQRLGLAPHTCLLAYFGFLSESKGGEILLRALAQTSPDTHLLFIGGKTGSSDAGTNLAYQQRLEQLIADHALASRVHWTGFIPQEDVSAYLHAADIVVIPYLDGASLRRGSMMAALAHGRPLVTTAPAIPTPEFSHGHNVYLVPAADVAALARAIQTLAEDSDMRLRLGRGAAELASLFTWPSIAAQTVAFFDQLLEHEATGGNR